MNSKRHVSWVFLICLVLMATNLWGEGVQVLEKKDLTVLFETPLGPAAKQVADIYRGIKGEVETTLGWNLAGKPIVLLISDSGAFLRLAESPLTVAFAVPSKGLIVINYGKMKNHLFKIEDTLRHEICHLLLHQHIRRTFLPRWLDEGVCQWASGGVVDIIIDQKQSLLNKAAFRGRFISLGSLQRGFPRDKDSLLLAYEQSKSFVDHIIGRYGIEGLLKILEHMKNGEDLDTAFLRTISISFDRLEDDWHRSLKKKVTWFVYLSYHLYDILFALMALLVIGAFIRIIVKKRAYGKGEPE